MNTCHWRCVIGNQWVLDTNFPNTCPAEEHCDVPTHRGVSGDLTETTCIA